MPGWRAGQPKVAAAVVAVRPGQRGAGELDGGGAGRAGLNLSDIHVVVPVTAGTGRTTTARSMCAPVTLVPAPALILRSPAATVRRVRPWGGSCSVSWWLSALDWRASALAAAALPCVTGNDSAAAASFRAKIAPPSEDPGNIFAGQRRQRRREPASPGGKMAR